MSDFDECFMSLQLALDRPYATMRFTGIQLTPSDDAAFIYGVERKPTALFRGLHDIDGRGRPVVGIPLNPELACKDILRMSDHIARAAEESMQELALSSLH